MIVMGGGGGGVRTPRPPVTWQTPAAPMCISEERMRSTECLDYGYSLL